MSDKEPSKDLPPDPSLGKADILRGVVRTEVEDMLREPQFNLPHEFLNWLPQYVDLNMLQHGSRHRNTGPDPIPITSVTSASAATGGNPFQIDVFATAGSATYTTPTTSYGSVPSALVFEAVGGGGGGGSTIAISAASATVVGAGGGGGGGYDLYLITESIETSYTITVGAGGTAGATATGSDGGSGGTSLVTSAISGTIMQAFGGGGGGGISAATSDPLGGVGSVGGSFGQIEFVGDDGQTGTWYTGGKGGVAARGGGGSRGATTKHSALNGVQGGGGGGGCPVNTGASNPGGSGGAGVVIVTAFG